MEIPVLKSTKILNAHIINTDLSIQTNGDNYSIVKILQFKKTREREQ